MEQKTKFYDFLTKNNILSVDTKNVSLNKKFTSDFLKLISKNKDLD
jgi:hypothetical protein